jgi:quinol monooxygenase YgiN
MICHSVFLKLKYPQNSSEEKLFLDAARALVNIPGVRNFKVLKETSPKNPFEYGLSMEFEDQQQYDAYSSHPDHQQFVSDYWIPFVEEFMEIDYEEL